jgi:hypothetical protein
MLTMSTSHARTKVVCAPPGQGRGSRAAITSQPGGSGKFAGLINEG